MNEFKRQMPRLPFARLVNLTGQFVARLNEPVKHFMTALQDPAFADQPIKMILGLTAAVDVAATTRKEIRDHILGVELPPAWTQQDEASFQRLHHLCVEALPDDDYRRYYQLEQRRDDFIALKLAEQLAVN